MPIIRIHFSGDDFLLAVVGVLDALVLACPKPARLGMVGWLDELGNSAPPNVG